MKKTTILSLVLLTTVICSCSLINGGKTSESKSEPKKVVINDSDGEEISVYSLTKEELKKAGKPHVVYFDKNSHKLDKEALSILNKNVLVEAKDKNTKKVVVEAHCDERGSDKYNQSLSEKRAMSVKNFLISKGVKAEMVKTIGFGESKPVALGHDEESWSKNRRAVTISIRR
jgi:outer membrane protein OmpA-like peptidoglycan-associated protein